MAYDNQGAAVGAAGHYAAALTSALITAGIITDAGEAVATFGNLLPEVFAACETLKGDQPEQAAPARSRGYANRGGSGGARKASGGGNNDPGSVDFRGGKFAGKTIADVYADSEGDGPGYLEWCVENLKNDFMVSKIEAFLATV